MKGSLIWKIVLTGLVALYAVANLIPPTDTPFEEFVVAEARAETEAFGALVAEAQERVDADTAAVMAAREQGEVIENANPSVFIALKNIATERTIDLSRYFPHIDVTRIRNLAKRNEVLMTELLSRSQGKVRLGLDLKGGVGVTFEVAESDLAEDQFQREEQLSKARSIIAQRVDGLGVAEPVIRLKGENQIEVQMPGISTRDQPNILETIGAPALLEFSQVHRTAVPGRDPVPLGYERKIEEREDPETGEIQFVPHYVKKIPDMTGEIISEAFATPNEFGGFRILLQFTNDGNKQFARTTRRIAEENERTGSIGQMAIILDGQLYSAPTVRQEISGGAEITGRFSQREALELANVLNNPLEFGLEVVEMFEVGPTLATDARDASINAGLLGAFLVICFMLFYYRVPGVVAITTVGLNLLLVIGILAGFGATITLPGVAALVLTIGMAVDANILIFERIREERKAGKSIGPAVEAGFDKAFSTIFDANLTTLITASILIWLGTGPVKGFGVTLAVGILATMFCALVVSRWMLHLLVNAGALEKSFQFQLFKGTNVNFLNYAKRAFMTAWAIVGLGVVGFIFHFDDAFGIDFVGGDEVTIAYDTRLSAEEIDAVALAGGFGEVNPFFQSIIGQDRSIIKVQTEIDQGESFYNALALAHPEAGLEMTGMTQIGAAVGANVVESALLSVALALLAIVLYIAIRFEWGYGIGALVATIHDIFMTVGLFVFLGEFIGMGSGQFTAPMIAAILMIVGYSINDTIVVFDRIREELELNPGMNLRNVVHLSINRVLNRTILTSITTLLATFALYIFGAGIIVDFALVFLLGILTGTFSSIFIASPIFFWYHKGDRKGAEEKHLLPTYDWTSESKMKKEDTPKTVTPEATA